MGLKSRGCKLGAMDFHVFIVLCLVMLSTWCVTTVSAHRDSCNWIGSGLDNQDHHLPSSRVVRPLTFMCLKGQVKWTYPRGGLQINFKPRTTSVKSGSEFKVCIKVDRDFSGARIYQEGHRKLLLLHAGSGDTRPLELVRCFVSVKGVASLYVEAVQIEGEGHGKYDSTNKVIQGQLVKKTASFSYDLRPLSPREYDDDFEECRPCSETEILNYFCQSEYVIRGHMSSIHHNHPMETSELGVKVTRVVRSATKTANQKSSSNNLNEGQTVTLHRPIKCGSKLGEGEFIFMGRSRLGEPVVTCAPRYHEWQKIRRQALLDDTNPCILD